MCTSNRTAAIVEAYYVLQDDLIPILADIPALNSPWCPIQHYKT